MDTVIYLSELRLTIGCTVDYVFFGKQVIAGPLATAQFHLVQSLKNQVNCVPGPLYTEITYEEDPMTNLDFFKETEHYHFVN